MEEYTANFHHFEDINDEFKDPFDLYLGYIEIKNNDSVITKFEFDINDIYEVSEYTYDAVYRVTKVDVIPLFNNFVKKLEDLDNAKLSFSQRNGERYFEVNGNIFKFHLTEELFSFETNYIINESLINSFKAINNIIKSKFKT